MSHCLRKLSYLKKKTLDVPTTPARVTTLTRALLSSHRPWSAVRCRVTRKLSLKSLIQGELSTRLLSACSSGMAALPLVTILGVAARRTYSQFSCVYICSVEPWINITVYM